MSASAYDPDPALCAAFGLQNNFNNAAFPKMFNFGLPEAMGYVTKSLTRTVGADLRTGGIIQDSHDMSSYGPGHGGFGSILRVME